ncbi:MAG: hypothetical protein KKB66_02465 [Alphaproteobacteria bacterium]|nr:hypothetical protein [Alphaproteobacteria bacterium]MBU0802125.1 hypothetical protein [Alphaproteobacteria bacterium]MBU0872268.1 hypothetical protein [Alphaproteobacteria bacterium]MBU1399624.1 hypothetical protein [Alphaproteobacteria bacterium]MBU1590010.1 hypothetical protein [Alphaproteobacteria bacterium]
METASGLLNAPNSRIGLAVATLDEEKASILLSNSTSRNIVVKDIVCGLHIPIDADQINRDLLASKRDEDTLSDVFLDANEAIGVFLISYTLDGNVVLPPNGRVLIQGLTEHISPPLKTERPSEPKLAEKVGSYCTASGVDEANDFSVGAVGLPIDSVLKLDIVTFINLADFSPSQQEDKAKLLAQINAVRNANRSAREAGKPQ